LKWQEECRKAKELKDIKAQQMKDMRGDPSLSQASGELSVSNSLDTSMAAKSLASKEKDDETVDDKPALKKVKVDL
jgi:hypothetical protein